MNLIPIFIGQSIVALIVIVTHVWLYVALKHVRAVLDDANARIKHLEQGLK